MTRYPLLALVCFLMCVLVSPVAAARTIEFETSEVTQSDVALSPDDQWLVFSMLGHLFRLPVEGGAAEQLTFGPYYDTDHAISPDGSRVAFVSDRDGSEGNVFVLELASGKITQVTHESLAGRPTWAPDGGAIVYLSFVLEESLHRYVHWGPAPAVLRRVALSGGEVETLVAPAREFRSIFYTRDGHLGWVVIKRDEYREEGIDSAVPHFISRIQVMDPQGTVTDLQTLAGIVDRVVISSAGDGIYCRRFVPLAKLFYYTQQDHLLLLSLPGGVEQSIVPVSGTWYWSPRFAVASDSKTLYVSDTGRLWKIALPSGAREPIAFSARVRLEVQPPVPPPKVALGAFSISAPPRVLIPRLSPDGRRLVLGAAGYLWQQPLDDGPARRMFEGHRWEWDSVFSPDGKRLAFAQFEHGKAEIKVFDFETGRTHSLASGGDPDNLSWSPDGQQIAFIEGEEEVKVLDLASGQTRTVASGEFHPHLSWSADAKQLIFCDHKSEGDPHRVVAVSLSDGTRTVLVDELVPDAGDVRVSDDGQSLYFSAKGRFEIWVASLGHKSEMEQGIRRLSSEGGSTYTLTSDSSALIYSTGNRVWRQPLNGGDRLQIPVRLELQSPAPLPLLLQQVRVLDFTAGGFGPETSLFIEQGRIRWIGSQHGRELPPETVTLDGAGRFAIPGLFDMHVHGGRSEVFLAYGVTSVRNVGAGLGPLSVLVDRSGTVGESMPRFFYSGDMFVGADHEGARGNVRRWKEGGAQFIKVHYPITWAVQRAVAEEARRLGLPVVGHGTYVEEITKSVTLGYTTLEHSDRPYDDVFQMLALAGTRWDPTLTNAGRNALLFRDEPERLADLKFRAFQPEWQIRRARRGGIWKDKSDRALRARWIEVLAGIRAAHRHGVKLLAGTDSPLGQIFSGTSLHWELEYLVEAGLAPVEVLRIATQEAAATVGAEDDLGTLEVDKLADIVLLDANPLEDIKNTQTIWRVIKGGVVFDPEELSR